MQLKSITRKLNILEFEPERDVLSTFVLPELQSYCCDRDIDLECCTFFANNFDYGQLNFLLSNIEQGNANVLVRFNFFLK